MSKKSPSKKSSSNSNNDTVPFVITHKAFAISLLAVTIFVISGLAWWKNVYNSPRRVFETMIVNNLQTQSFTKSTKSDNGGSKSAQDIQISFVPEIASKSLESVTQNSSEGVSVVKQEKIGSLKADYIRYVSIKISKKNKDGKPLDYSGVENIWGKVDSSQQPPQYLIESFLGLVPFGNLDTENRSLALSVFYDKKAYDVDYSKVKPLRINGKSALVYPVKVKLSSYIELLKVISKSSGVGNLPELNPENYKEQPDSEIEIVVDKLSRRVLQVKQGQGQEENYSAYGLSMPIQIPKNAKPVSELQQKIQEIK